MTPEPFDLEKEVKALEKLIGYCFDADDNHQDCNGSDHIKDFARRVREQALEEAASACDKLSDQLDSPSEKVFSSKFKKAIKQMTGSIVSEECAEIVRALKRGKE